MASAIYIEKEILHHPRTERILQKLRASRIIEIDKYSEVFNRKNQNFRVQKEQGKTFILARKRDHFVLPSPSYCTADTDLKFYFSHMYNCPYDCEYCFLQGMYRSAFFVLFVNYEDFAIAIEQKLHEVQKKSHDKVMFFASYDNDSLALEEVTGFAEYFIPVFEPLEGVTFELRSKAAHTRIFEQLPPARNTLSAWTLSPDEVQKQWEHGTASLAMRIKALNKAQRLGWRTAIRIEPLLWFQEWEDVYANFFETLEREIDFSRIENLIFGQFRLPRDIFKTMKKMLPRSTLLTKSFVRGGDDEITYGPEKERALFDFVYNRSMTVLPPEKIFYYTPKGQGADSLQLTADSKAGIKRGEQSWESGRGMA